MPIHCEQNPFIPGDWTAPGGHYADLGGDHCRGLDEIELHVDADGAIGGFGLVGGEETDELPPEVVDEVARRIGEQVGRESLRTHLLRDD